MGAGLFCGLKGEGLSEERARAEAAFSWEAHAAAEADKEFALWKAESLGLEFGGASFGNRDGGGGALGEWRVG